MVNVKTINIRRSVHYAAAKSLLNGLINMQKETWKRRGKNMRKLRRAVLRNEANRLSRHGRNGKSIAIFRSLWDDYKELRQHKNLEQKEKGLLEQIRNLRKRKAAAL